MRISVELVPRRRDDFIHELSLVKNNFSSVETVNIPDISRYELRSVDAAGIAKDFFPQVIPHIRAGVINASLPLPFTEILSSQQVTEVLVISGDRPSMPESRFVPNAAVDVIKRIKRDIPGMTVYAGIDQYRWDFEREYDYVQKKIDAGADGFFTQPFFDFRLLELYAKKIKRTYVFWGVSPVLSDRSRVYWETKNKVVFPSDFETSLTWSWKFGRKVMALVQDAGSGIYFMPIRTDVIKYLEGVIG